MLIKVAKQFFKQEAAGGIMLFFAAMMAVVLDNSPLAGVYNAFLNFQVSAYLGSVLHSINDGLMVLFFLAVGLELKREMVQGHLSELSNVVLPMIAALGGMVVPALIYYGINYQDPLAMKGWAIPVATDIAFVLAVLSLLGKRVPTPVKLFLLAVTIFDDIGAIVIIAVFHTQDLSWMALVSTLVVTGLLVLLNLYRVQTVIPYAILGFMLWFCVLKSGVHATLAGVILAFTIPVKGAAPKGLSSLEKLEQRLLPWVSFLILPLFGFANSGISFIHAVPGVFSNNIVLGIVLGLFFGKQIGIFLYTWLCVKLRLCKLPTHSTWLAIYAMSVLCGIGFTMSLFMGTLAFTGQDAELLISVRFGVFVASMIAGVCGYTVLRRIYREI